MTAMRWRLSTIATFWLLLQFAGMAAPLTLTAFGSVAAGPGATEEPCTCPGVEHGALCPMHHTPSSTRGPSSTSKPNDSGPCRLQNASAPTDVALLSLAGGTGVLATAIGYNPPMPPTGPVIADIADRLFHPYRPDSPPPRS